MDNAKYDALIDGVLKSEELELLCHVNPDLRESVAEAPLLTGAFFMAMQDALPRRVWSCPILGGTLLRMMCADPMQGGQQLTYAAQAWANALGGDKR